MDRENNIETLLFDLVSPHLTTQSQHNLYHFLIGVGTGYCMEIKTNLTTVIDLRDIK